MLFPRFRSRLTRFISRLSSIMSLQTTNIEILLSPAGVNLSHHVAVWAGHVTSPDTLTAGRNYHIVSGTWFKRLDGPQHEALELKFINTEASNTGWLLIERSGAEQHTPGLSPSPSSTSINTSADRSGQLSSQLPAIDTVAVSAASPISGTRSNYLPVATLLMPANSANPLTICDLAALLSVASLKRPEYNFYKGNCYWFVALIVGAIEVVHRATVTLVSTGTSAGHLSVFRIVSSEDIRKDLLVVVPAWNNQKGIYWGMKTTEEIKQEADEREARLLQEAEVRREAEVREAEVRVKQAEEQAQREAEAHRQSSEAHCQSSEAYEERQAQAEQDAEVRRRSSEAKNAVIHALQARLAQLSTTSDVPIRFEAV